MRSSVTTPDGRVREVQDLGWFFRKARKTVTTAVDFVRYRGEHTWHMYAAFDDGYRYYTPFGSDTVFKDMVARQRSLRGVPVRIVDGADPAEKLVRDSLHRGVTNADLVLEDLLLGGDPRPAVAAELHARRRRRQPR